MADAAIPLSAEDKAILDLECAAIAGHTCKVVALGGDGVGIEELRGRIAARLPAAPELGRALGGTPERPAWVPAPGFDLAEHVRLSALGPAPDRAAVLAEVASLFEQRLDRDRPLWAIDLIPRPAGGSVLVWRIHHALADGTAAMRLARELLWDRDRAGQAASPPPAREHPDHERRRAHLAAFIEREFAGSLHRSPFDGRVGARRRVALAQVPLGELHDAAKRLAGATLNDAVLAVVAGSLRRWIEERHGSLADVRVRVPVSLHHEGDDASNRDSFFSVRLPLAVPDPVERLRAVNRETTVRKRAHDAERIEGAVAAIGRRSPRLAALVERIEASPREFAVSVSNVPGPRQPVSVLGAPVEELHSIAEIGLRHGLRVTAVSLADRLFFGFNADPELVEGVESMARGVEVEADALIDSR
ncbi:MAG TPA: wax ester/triacylglycerol synthase domain-containing protein [Solirubrobacterales bacterium]|nr:wax ester/triacylglycerol synthase domain-containing protein [Solirubrobacterales bacterium]